MSASNSRPKYQGTSHQWDTITEDLLIIARDPFSGELSALRKHDAVTGVVICDLKASLPKTRASTEAHLRNAAIRNEVYGNARLIMGAHGLLSTALELQHLLIRNDIYGQAKQRMKQLLDAAITDAIARPIPTFDQYGQVDEK